MIILLDTSGPVCYLTLTLEGGERFSYEWQADRQLAKGLHAFIYDKMKTHSLDWRDVSAIGVFRGPGSYTGLRIGLTVMNTLASGLRVSIVGASGEDWQKEAMTRLLAGDNDRIVLPEYGGGANITTPRK